jgi:RNA polymerase sigma factor (sigma-70 family)
MNRTPENRMDAASSGSIGSLTLLQPLVDQLFAASGAASWGLPRDLFAAALERSASKRFGPESPGAAKIEEYLSTLHLQDLALACACAEARPDAWDHFVATFRAYMRSAAGAILRCPPDSPAACELADSLFADLYGLGESTNRRSLFRYFHGRSSLKTWLRAVLAQRQVDAIRASRRFTDLDSADGHAAARPAAQLAAPRRISSAGPEPLQDPHRSELLTLFHRTLEVALGLLEARDKERLRLYYAAQQTLAEIGRKLGEHESSVSRNLERTRRELRQQVEQALRKGGSVDGVGPSAGLSDAQIALCFEYAAEDAPIDLDTLLPESQATVRKTESKKL